ncbi:beta-xylosidase [Moniliophthora roreri MCA 2997]|uniref:Beta-xylosidase n=2 Tax=Moniliophthora roreri TaxID=221103 RepID=V2XJB1_MONRO|nr:beta-xylosidase [Moniliophthora roreri MCA 2997]
MSLCSPRLGFFDPADRLPYRQLSWADINTESARQAVYQAAVEGTVLLKNDGVLPLASSVKKVAVIGSWANTTTQIQPNYFGAPPFLISPQQVFRDAGFDVAPANGTAVNSKDTSGFTTAVAAANSSDAVFFIGGSTPRLKRGLDRAQISWPGNQLDLIK